ncbi:MAG: 4-oxalomesaconate tautomerase, partial [Rhodobacteraceae bacterium]|nr:4-oxalomesaconate tautomerase [Paracoccaceae bacterium]
ARVQTPGGRVRYDGDAHIDGVPGTHAPIPLMFQNIAGSMCGSLLPSGAVVDLVDGVACTLIDNGMPCVVMAASDFGLTGQESRDDLDANTALKARLESIRLAVGPMMNLGDVTEKSVPKMTLVSAPVNGGAISTRSFIPTAATRPSACSRPSAWPRPAPCPARLPRRWPGFPRMGAF